MIEALFRWVARSLAAILERYADPDLEARLAAYKAKVAAQEQAIKEAQDAARASEAAYQTSLNYRNELNTRLHESEQIERELESQLAESHLRIGKLKDDAEAAKKQIDALSDHAVIRGDV